MDCKLLFSPKWLRTAPLLFASVVSMTEAGHSQMITAHRGASHDAPENTLAAFDEAWRQGADAIECDCYFTSDGHIVCIHDADTRRTAGKKVKVATSSLTELRQMEYGSWKSKKYAGEPIPTLDQVLEQLPRDKTIVIELKTGPKIVPLLKELLAQKKTPVDQVLIISFHQDTVAQCKALMPEFRVHWLTGYKADTRNQLRPTVQEVAETLRSCKADGLGTKGDRNVVTPEYVAELREQGMQEFHVWTIDAPRDAAYFRDLGAMGITTNRPAYIRDALETQDIER